MSNRIILQFQTLQKTKLDARGDNLNREIRDNNNKKCLPRLTFK